VQTGFAGCIQFLRVILKLMRIVLLVGAFRAPGKVHLAGAAGRALASLFRPRSASLLADDETDQSIHAQVFQTVR